MDLHCEEKCCPTAEKLVDQNLVPKGMLLETVEVIVKRALEKFGAIPSQILSLGGKMVVVCKKSDKGDVAPKGRLYKRKRFNKSRRKRPRRRYKGRSWLKKKSRFRKRRRRY